MYGKNVIGGTFEDLNEAVVKPVTDEVGKALEQGVQTVISGPKQTQNPQNPQAKQAETQAKLAESRRKIKWWQDLEEAQRRVRDQEKQKIVQKQSLDSARDKQIKQFEIVKQKENLALNRAQRKTEIKGGVGG